MNDISHPMVRPTVWHVEAYDRFSRDNRVSDHPVYLSARQMEDPGDGLPSTAMSKRSSVE